MATAYIEEFEEMAKDKYGNVLQIGKQPAIATQTVTFTTTTESAAFNASTNFVKITVDAEAHYKFAAYPTTATATTSHPQMQADREYWFGVTENGKVAFVAA